MLRVLALGVLLNAQPVVVFFLTVGRGIQLGIAVFFRFSHINLLWLFRRFFYAAKLWHNLSHLFRRLSHLSRICYISLALAGGKLPLKLCCAFWLIVVFFVRVFQYILVFAGTYTSTIFALAGDLTFLESSFCLRIYSLPKPLIFVWQILLVPRPLFQFFTFSV